MFLDAEERKREAGETTKPDATKPEVTKPDNTKKQESKPEEKEKKTTEDKKPEDKKLKGNLSALVSAKKWCAKMCNLWNKLYQALLPLQVTVCVEVCDVSSQTMAVHELWNSQQISVFLLYCYCYYYVLLLYCSLWRIECD